MSELPVSVRLALWATASYAGALPLAEAVARACADLDVVTGRLERLDTWRELGEQAVLVALPHAGAVGLLPRGVEGTEAALEAGECVFVPGLGDVMVPTVSELGPTDGPRDDRVGAVRWAAYSGDPVPVHLVDALDLREVDRRLRTLLVEATLAFEAIDEPGWAGDGLRELVDSRLDDPDRAARWGLPDGLSARARRVITQAATLGTIADLALSRLRDAASLDVTLARQDLLRGLRRDADQALAEATCVAAAHLAGWRGPDRD